jgi:cytochrome P450
VRDEVLSLLHAGQETTAAALSWLWYRVAQHTAVQARMMQEIDKVLGGRPATLADVPSLVYTGWVLREVLRLHGPTWTLFPRQAIREVRIGGYLLPRGSWVFIYPYALHRDSRWFAEPEEFDPERFAPGRVEHIPPGAYIPFGAGAHVCLGRRFALTTMTLIAATVLQGFHLALAPGQATPEPEPYLALRPKGGVRIALAHRSSPKARSEALVPDAW